MLLSQVSFPGRHPAHRRCDGAGVGDQRHSGGTGDPVTSGRSHGSSRWGRSAHARAAV